MVSLHQKFRWENFHPTGIVDVAASPLNNTLVSCGLDGKLVFFDLKTGRECHSMLMEMAMRPTRLLWRSPSELVVGCVNGMLAVLTVTVGGKTVSLLACFWRNTDTSPCTRSKLAHRSTSPTSSLLPFPTLRMIWKHVVS